MQPTFSARRKVTKISGIIVHLAPKKKRKNYPAPHPAP